jgi:hypothetical protein
MVLCHLFNLSTLAGMSVNLPRLEYLSGRMDRDTYLSLTLASYPAIAWVRNHVPAGAPILAIGTHAIAYAPDPVLMDSLFLEDGPFPPGDVQRAISNPRYRYAIVSKRATLDALFDRGPVFEDSQFAVFGLP